MAKLFVCEAANRCADRALQIFGGRGYMRTNVAERFWRELRVDRIWEGTSEIQRLIVARALETPRRGARAVGPLTRGRTRSRALLAPRGFDRGRRGVASGRGPTAARRCSISRGSGTPGASTRSTPRRADRARRARAIRSLDDLPEAPDAVVVAIPAADAPDVVERARALGCGGAVVFAAGFAEARETELQRALADAADGLPVCGPNGNGIVSLPDRVALWGDAIEPREPGPVALISQSRQRRRQRARVAARAAAAHGRLVRQPGGARRGRLPRGAGRARRRALGRAVSRGRRRRRRAGAPRWSAARDAGIGVAVLKAGRSRAGAAAAEAHTGALAGDQRVFRALFEEAGAAWAEDPHDLLELAKALACATAARAPRGGGAGRRSAAHARAGVAVMTCSGGDSAVAADLAAELGVDLPALAPGDDRPARGRSLPDAATAANPLDYTALLWDDPEALQRADRSRWRRPRHRPGAGALRRRGRRGTRRGRRSSTRCRPPAQQPDAGDARVDAPELLDDEAATHVEAGMAAIAGLRSAIRAMQALARRRPTRTASRDGAAAPAAGSAGSRSTRPRRCCARPASPCPTAIVTRRRRSPPGDELGGPGRDQAPRPAPQGRATAAWCSTSTTRRAIRAAAQRLGAHRCSSSGWRRPGTELLVAIRRDGLVPVLVVGARRRPHRGARRRRGDPAAGVPRTASPRRSPRAHADPDRDRSRASPSAAALPLALIELNPVIVHGDGAVAVDALAQRRSTMNEIAAKLGEVGLPAPVKELAASDWDAVIVGGGHNGLTAAAYLAKAGQRCSCSSGASGSAARARSSARSRRALRDQPVRLRRRPARRAGDPRAGPASARLRVLHRRPQPVGAVRRRHELRPVARRRQDPGQPRGAEGLQGRHRRLLGLRAPLRRDPPAPAHRRARHVARRHADARGDRGAAARRADDDRHRLRARRSPTSSTTTSPTSGSRTRSSARA